MFERQSGRAAEEINFVTKFDRSTFFLLLAHKHTGQKCARGRSEEKNDQSSRRQEHTTHRTRLLAEVIAPLSRNLVQRCGALHEHVAGSEKEVSGLARVGILHLEDAVTAALSLHPLVPLVLGLDPPFPPLLMRLPVAHPIPLMMPILAGREGRGGG